MQQLSELDSSFLFLENDRTPLHVGGLFIFKKSANSSFHFNRFRDILETKLPNEPFFRERLVEKPLGLEMPYWAEDPDFSLDNHLKYKSLENRNEKLITHASRVFSTPLDKSKPLWHVTYVDNLKEDEGYGKDHFALVLRIHITALNGTTGEDILSQLLQLSPELIEIAPVSPWQPEPLPDSGGILGSAYNGVLTLPQKLAEIAKDTASSAFYSILHERLQKLNLPASVMRVAKTPINKAISKNRIIDNLEIPFDVIRAIRSQLKDVTTNDVLMGICAEAMRLYLEESEEDTQIPLIALAPISVRSTSLDVKSGHQLAATLFSLVTTEKDPIRRIHLIHNAAQSSNSYDSAISANRLTELLPSCVAGLSARVYSEFLLAQKHKPMFNLPISNIPGPQFPLYMEDNELTHYICATPLFDGIGLAMTIISYNGVYSITNTYCPDLLGRPFSSYLNQALDNIHTILENGEDDSIKAASDSEEPAATGLIEDVVGLVSNLFTSNNKESSNEKEDA